ncbi:hypothetical protein HID58_042754 [Brassica napus]|uniref:Uncharacterized protein n=1 Tax=Brassica napus TaxID=3708 RepID=A0ABQ8BEM0_BRANA|nr:hypothetical protein HID58_042754 [Brassica napus]
MIYACSDSGFFCHKSWYKRGIERPRFRAEQEVLHPSFGREDEGDYKEGFTIGTEGPKKGPHHDKTLYSPNIWPNPDVLPRWWETMEKYYQKALNFFKRYRFDEPFCMIRRVCKSIARIMALALDLDVNYFDTPDMLRNPIADMILFHCEGDSFSNHISFGCLIPQKEYMLVEHIICKDKDLKPQKWKYVPSIKGYYNEISSVYWVHATLTPFCHCYMFFFFFYRAYIIDIALGTWEWAGPIFSKSLDSCVNIGKQISHMLHLIDTVSSKSIEVFSSQFPFFLKPSHDCIIECLPTCQSENKPPKYPAIKCSTYLSQHYKAAHTHHKQT